jgi:predicted ester cyclase
MSEDKKLIVRRLNEGLWNERDSSVADDYIDQNLMPEGPFTDGLPRGPEGQKAFASVFLAAFPDVHCTIERQEVDGDVVKTWMRFNGTQTGALMDIPPTGNRASVPVLSIDRIQDDKIVESRTEWDPNDMLRQLGVDGAANA